MIPGITDIVARIRTRAELSEMIQKKQAQVNANPREFIAVLQLGVLLSLANDVDGAVCALDRAAALNPGEAAPFTLKSTLKFRRHFGPPPKPREVPSASPSISMRTLGLNGKFGNQLLQYAFLRLYAARFGLLAETADWIGRDLFDLDDPLPHAVFPVIEEQRADLFGSLNGRTSAVYSDRDLLGYFCRHTAEWGGRISEFRDLYVPSRRIQGLLQTARDSVTARGHDVVAIHIRHGDFGRGQFWIAPVSWYVAWLERIWGSLNWPVLYVASDDAAVKQQFSQFSAIDISDLDVTLPGAEFYLDHFLLSVADRVAISNSTFSFTAAMLNARAQTFVRPDPSLKALVDFDPWNAEVMLPRA